MCEFKFHNWAYHVLWYADIIRQSPQVPPKLEMKSIQDPYTFCHHQIHQSTRIEVWVVKAILAMLGFWKHIYDP